MKRLIIQKISFRGDQRVSTDINFREGLNVISGASDTGKSFLFECIDFMLGAQDALRKIPAASGYTTVFMEIGVKGGDTFTLERHRDGGSFRLFRCALELMDSHPPTVLAKRHGNTGENISRFLLELCGLPDRKLKKNAQNEKRPLSFRNVAEFALVNEQRILGTGSPIHTGIPTERTPELSVFKLLLTGQDASSLIEEPDKKTKAIQLKAKIGLIDELIMVARRNVPDEEFDVDRVAAMLDDATFAEANLKTVLNNTQELYRYTLNQRAEKHSKLELTDSRRIQLIGLLKRFNLLKAQYESDIQRLEAIELMGSLLSVRPAGPCPLCGTENENHKHAPMAHDEDIDAVRTAARAEQARVLRLIMDLNSTVTDLETEARGVEQAVSALRTEVNSLQLTIDTNLTPVLKDASVSFAEVLEQKSRYEQMFAAVEELNTLETRRSSLLESSKLKAPQKEATSEGSIAEEVEPLCLIIQDILKKWHFPDLTRVTFSEEKRDIIISGQARNAYGKGLRAISFSAFIYGLLRYCEKQFLPHPGFIVLDSPLVTYRSPDQPQEESVEGEYISEEVKDNFYRSLALDSVGQQVIIFENVDPPDDIKKQIHFVSFTGNSNEGRAGFFPEGFQQLDDQAEI